MELPLHGIRVNAVLPAGGDDASSISNGSARFPEIPEEKLRHEITAKIPLSAGQAHDHAGRRLQLTVLFLISGQARPCYHWATSFCRWRVCSSGSRVDVEVRGRHCRREAKMTVM